MIPWYSFEERYEALREAKKAYNLEKQKMCGTLNGDDLGIILPPEDRREIVNAVSGSGVPITDVILTGVEVSATHEDGAFYGPKACGENFAALLRAHPPFVDPMSTLAGAYMANFGSYRKSGWDPDIEYSRLHEEQRKYGLITGIGAPQHFCQDLKMGLELGWSGILEKIHRFRGENSPNAGEFYDGLEATALAIQDWIGRNAVHAAALADREDHAQLKTNLREIAEINHRLISEPPSTFREACQWIVWYQMAARMYNGSGAMGKIDLILEPFFKKDVAAGILTEEEAAFHIACILLRDTAYIQIGGPDVGRADVTSRLSYLVLEAAHRLRIPCNIAVAVGRDVDPGLLRRGVEIMLEDRQGTPKFIGIDNFISGFERNGYSHDLAATRAYAGCHWCAIPGREFTLNDCVKINFAAVFQVAFDELFTFENDDIGIGGVSTANLWALFLKHLRRSIEVTAEGIDFQVEHMHEVFPELVLDLLCHGPIESGIDASHGGVEFVNLCVDGAGLATVADSFAALELRVEQERLFTWEQMREFIDDDWPGKSGERARLAMNGIERYGSGGSPADRWAGSVETEFTRMVKENPTPDGHNMIPGLFSWAST
ncbi:MAG: pyruvate formate lyase family protein, partial [Spirochaetia bacterium]